MRFFLISLLVLIVRYSIAQSDCTLSISGRVIDEHDNTALAFAEVTIPELKRGTVVDSNGYFLLSNLCAGNYTLVTQHIGCEPVVSRLSVSQNIRDFTIYLEHHTTLLKEADVQLEPILQLIKINNAKTLATLNLPELRVQKTGENVFKPIVRGFSGNRVSTYVGNVELQDQQWGTDHGLSLQFYPDNELNVYSNSVGNSFSGLQISSNNPFQKKSSVFASAYSNGLGAKIGALQNYKVNDDFAFGGRFQLNRSGDKNAPDYILSNTSSAQANAQIDAAFIKNDWNLNFTSSYDYKSLSTLAASHIGNVNDFYTALAADEPVIQNDFTYDIQNPKQEVEHFIASAKAIKNYTNKNAGGNTKSSGAYEYFYNYQLNSRKEFEARRSKNSDVPALNLQLQTHQIGTHFFRNNFGKSYYKFELGGTQNFGINTNLPGPSYEPILPNYNSYISNIYVVYTKTLPELAKRFHFISFTGSAHYTNIVAQFFESSDLQQEVFQFTTAAANVYYSSNRKTSFDGTKYGIDFTSKLNFTQRAPAPNELLISGVHHGTATIEEGNLNLQPETKIGLEQQAEFYPKGRKTKFSFNLYANYIDDYIYQIPLAEPRLTIRGAFPVFQFTQTNAFFSGVEIEANQQLGKFLTYNLSLNYIYAQDVENDSPLPLIPPFEWKNNLRFEKKVNDTWQNFYVQAEHIYNGRQFRFNPDLDLTTPPPDYSLFNASIGISRVKTHTYTFSLRVENFTNQQYRNYLDRFRYFADAAGTNVLIECLIKF